MRNLLILCCDPKTGAFSCCPKCGLGNTTTATLFPFFGDACPNKIRPVIVSQAQFQGPRKVSFNGLPYRPTCQFGRAASIRTRAVSRKFRWRLAELQLRMSNSFGSLWPGESPNIKQKG